MHTSYTNTEAFPERHVMSASLKTHPGCPRYARRVRIHNVGKRLYDDPSWKEGVADHLTDSHLVEWYMRLDK